MRLKTTTWGLATLLVMTAPIGGAQAQIQVSVDESPVTFQGQQPVQEGERVLVPLRGVFEQMGATVNYDDQTQTVRAERGDTDVSLTVGSREAKVDDKNMTLDVPTTVTGGSVLVPLRFVSEALGGRVNWNAQERSVTVTTNPATAGTAQTTETDPSAAGTMSTEAPTATPPGPPAAVPVTPEAAPPAPAPQPPVQSAPPVVAAPTEADDLNAVGQENTWLRYLPWILAAVAVAGLLAYLASRNKGGQVIAATKGGETRNRRDDTRK